MKKIFFVLCLFAVQNSFAQSNAIDSYYKNFQQKNTLNVVSLSGKLLTVLIDDKTGKEKEALTAILNKISGLKMLSKTDLKDGNDLFNSANTILPKTYKSILSIDEPDRKVKCYTIEKGNRKISEFIMIAWQWGRFMVLSLTGDLEIKEIYKLSQGINYSNLSSSIK